jgi:hypothetical protein
MVLKDLRALLFLTICAVKIAERTIRITMMMLIVATTIFQVESAPVTATRVNYGFT